MILNTAYEKIRDVESLLAGMESKQVPHELLFRAIEKIDGLGMIYFKKDGRNVRALKCTPEIHKVIGIRQEEIEGHLLNEFVAISDEDVWRSIQLVDAVGFMVKVMILSGTKIPTRAWIMKIGKDMYFEILWRLEDELE